MHRNATLRSLGSPSSPGWVGGSSSESGRRSWKSFCAARDSKGCLPLPLRPTPPDAAQANPWSYFTIGMATNEFTAPSWDKPFPGYPTLGIAVLESRGFGTEYWWVSRGGASAKQSMCSGSLPTAPTLWVGAGGVPEGRRRREDQVRKRYPGRCEWRRQVREWPRSVLSAGPARAQRAHGRRSGEHIAKCTARPYSKACSTCRSVHSGLHGICQPPLTPARHGPLQPPRTQVWVCIGVALGSILLNVVAFVFALTFLSGPSRSALLTEENLAEVSRAPWCTWVPAPGVVVWRAQGPLGLWSFMETAAL